MMFKKWCIDSNIMHELSGKLMRLAHFIADDVD